MLVVVLVTFVITWLPSILAQILFYHYIGKFLHEIYTYKIHMEINTQKYIQNNRSKLKKVIYKYNILNIRYKLKSILYIPCTHILCITDLNVEGKVLAADIIAMSTLLTFINSCLNPIFYALYSK